MVVSIVVAWSLVILFQLALQAGYAVLKVGDAGQGIIENIADLNSLPLPEARKLMQKLVLKERDDVLESMGLK